MKLNTKRFKSQSNQHNLLSIEQKSNETATATNSYQLHQLKVIIDENLETYIWKQTF